MPFIKPERALTPERRLTTAGFETVYALADTAGVSHI